MNKFSEYLKVRLKNDLPAKISHIKMTPKIFQRSFRSLDAAENARKSAVMIIMTNNSEPDILFTLRSSNMRSHKGQISFPGGRLDEGESPLDAAKRETHEEIGLNPGLLDVAGSLSPLFVPPSNNLIIPYVGFLDNYPNFKLSIDEVEETFSVNIRHFTDSQNLKITKEILEGYEVDIPFWDVGKKTRLWGATSMILQELIDIYNDWTNANQV
ncbi:MAG: CoA pyrophosphatase [Candidatus Kapabacteria bacterium]|nr:CoA pyrophosphatase [Ignavibacteriota bacterium]MCW5884737.1 CoA pyrophosphatase [Candidatus Kapabacteria bacterium]